MKLFYQQVLSFLLVIVITLSIIGFSMMNFITKQTYDNTFSQLEGYADSMGHIALKKDPITGRYQQIKPAFLDEFQQVMQAQNVTIRVFDEDNEQIYPDASLTPYSLREDVWQELQSGKSFRIQNDFMNNQPKLSAKEPYSSIMVPWFDGSKLKAVVWLGSKVSSVETTIKQAQRNSIVALLASVFAGMVISLIIVWFNLSRIKKLSRATKKVGEGDFSVRIEHKDNDEIDDLASDFNKMVESLKLSDEEIKRQEARRNQFMADVAHEMRTPLTTINGILEGLRYDAIPIDSKDKSIQLMQSETNRLIRLVNENLDYEKIRNNQIKLFKTEFNGTLVLENVVEQLSNNAKKKNNKLKLLSQEPVSIYADHDRFTQIIFNITQNAIQFTENGNVDLTIYRVDHATRVKIKDTGIGMSDEQKRFIFERFYKADPSRNNVGTGESGLGLAIVYSLVNQHHGKIEVDSQENKGTTFTLTFFDPKPEKEVDSE
ncbi:HAMP domain-containing sensor histidine kinase [Holzapfeliella sp. He02]|uniref:histidine kinase n=1 Tax=Holzapfeliella saturejae TaxID=3082953 RepID=A0ABU8SFV6_9LACO